MIRAENPDTLTSACNLAMSLAQGKYAEAELPAHVVVQTLTRSPQLGTLQTASSLKNVQAVIRVSLRPTPPHRPPLARRRRFPPALKCS